jgi:nucleotide-binding universal stress UspA family protein
VVCGAAGDELEKFSEQVDLLLLGSPSYGPFRRLMAGSASKRLLRSSHCPLQLSASAATSAELSS